MDASFVKGLKSWANLNAVRLPLNEDCWLGINGVPSNSSGAAYQAAYKAAVQTLTAANIAVLADLHWTAPGTGLATGQQALPDRDHAPQMWQGVAQTFKDNPLVIFELFNEPFPGKGSAKDDDWRCWANGTCTGCSDINFPVADMARLIQSVRATGATNVILLGGMAWSNDLSKWLEYAPFAVDRLHQTGAVWHACTRTNESFCTCQPVAESARWWQMTSMPATTRRAGAGRLAPSRRRSPLS